jgi:hypothetical protein
MQTKKQSLVEAISSTIFALLLSTIIIQPLVLGAFGIIISTSVSFQIALIFTVISSIRNYYTRRFFNYIFHKKDNNDRKRS